MNESKLVLKSGSSLNNVLQKDVDFLSVVFSLNGAVAEPSPSESVCQAYLAVDTIENVISGEGDFADGWAIVRNQDECDGSINCKPLIDGLLIRKLFLGNKNGLFILLNQIPRLRQECLPSIAVQDGTSSSRLSAKGKWSCPAETSRGSRSGRVDSPSFLVVVNAQDALASPSTGLSWM